MDDTSYRTSFTVDQTPQEAYAAINNVRAWWSGEIDGPTDELGAQFTYRYEDIHRSTQHITELVADEKVVWHVVDSYLAFADDKAEWTGTDIIFEVSKQGEQTEVRFTHAGLVPTDQCFENCSSAWTFLITNRLLTLITDGEAQPNTSLADRDRDGHRVA